MGFPIVEGIGLINAARGLIHELRSGGSKTKSAAPPQTVEIPASTFARLLAGQLKATPSAAAAQRPAVLVSTPKAESSSGAVQGRLDELVSQFEEALAEFRAQVGELFANNLIDEAHELDLSVDSSGNVTVGGSHPNAEQINAMFAAHPMLRYAFNRLAATASTIETRLDMFPTQLRNLANPQAAVAQYANLLNGQNAPSNFHLVIGPDGFRTYFGSDPNASSGTAA